MVIFHIFLCNEVSISLTNLYGMKDLENQFVLLLVINGMKDLENQPTLLLYGKQYGEHPRTPIYYIVYICALSSL